MQDTEATNQVGDAPTRFFSETQPSGSLPKSRSHDGRFRGYVRIRTLESFQHRSFRFLWATLFGGAFSGWMVNVVVGWLTFHLTHSPLLTGLAIGIGALPAVIVGPIAGVFVDAWDRRKTVAIALGLWALFVAGFGVVVIVGPVAPWHLFAFALLTGVAGSLLGPAEQALLANVIPKRLYVNGFALAGLAGSITRLAAPAFTGFSIALIGPGPTLMLAVIFLLVAIYSTLMIEGFNYNRHPLRPRVVLTELSEAAGYILHNKTVLSMTLLIASFMLLLTPVNMGLMPVYADEVFSGGPELLGLLVATLGAGNTIGAIVLASLGEIRQKGLLIVVTACITGVGLLAFSQSGTLLLAFSILVAYGATMVITYTVAEVVIQSIVPDNMRGRVVALSGTTLIAFPIGTLIVGGLAQLYGAPAATLVSGTALIAVVLLMSIAFRAEWSFNTGDEAKGCGTTEDTSQVGSADPGTQTVQSAIPRS